MKKITLLVASFLLVGTLANASGIIKRSGEVGRNSFSFNEPISFKERGIEFFVFPNGEFDFNTRPDDNQGDYFYKTAGRRSKIAQSRAPINYGTRIEHDSFGRVRRIGNTFINYDNRDRVNRIGSVFMRYNRFALTQIGGLQIIYNHRGEIVDTYGTVKAYSNYGYVYNDGNQNNQGNNFYDNSDNYTAYNTNDNDYYYYKRDGTRAKIENEKERK